MGEFILAIDQGTTGTTALIIDCANYQIVAKHNEEFPQIFPKPGHVEHNLNDIWHSVQKTVKKAQELAGIKPTQITAIGITNQRETTCAFDSKGSPLHNAIVWQDRRTTSMCNDLRDSYRPLQQKTGLPLDPYFSGSKMKWLLENSKEVQSAAKSGKLHFGTIDTFLLFKLTNCQSFKTECSNASRTLLMDLSTTNWDDQLLNFFGVNKNFLPEIVDSFENFGTTRGLDFLPDGIPIHCILGDQQAALFGQAGHSEGALKCTYGTGAFILLNTGPNKVYSSNGLLTTVAYRNKGKAIYALEGSCYIAGAAVQWLRDNLKIIDSSSEVEKLANQVTNLEQMESLMFMPFFTGLGSPYWNADARGALVGITRDTSAPHIARACLDGIALSVNDSIQSLITDSPKAVNSINVDGGACANNLLMQIQANFSDRKIIRPKVIETTAYGVAIGAILGQGKISFSDIDKLWQEDKSFEPQTDDYYANKKEQWTATIKKLF